MSIASERVDELRAHAGVAEREHLRAQQHHAAHLGDREVGARRRVRVRPHEVPLQRADVGRGDARLG